MSLSNLRHLWCAKFKKLPPGNYRAVLLDVDTKASSCDTNNISLHYVLISAEDCIRYEFTETFSDNILIGRSAEFFFFLEKTHVDFDNYRNLVGLVFDTVLQYDFTGGKEVPILTQKSLVALPPK